MVRYLWVFLLICHCYYDATPPTDLEKEAFQGELVVYISELAPKQRVGLFYRKLSNGAWENRFENLWATNSGELYFTYLLESQFREIEVKLICDDNLNGEIELHEPFYTSPPILFTKEKPVYYLKLTRGDFTS